MGKADDEELLKPIMTVSEASRYMRLSRSTIYKLMETGEIAYLQVGRKRLLRREDVLGLLEKSLVSSRSLEAEGS